MGLKYLEMNKWDASFAKTFTMVEEKFELRGSEISQNEGIGKIFRKNFTMVEEDYEGLKSS